MELCFCKHLLLFHFRKEKFEKFWIDYFETIKRKISEKLIKMTKVHFLHIAFFIKITAAKYIFHMLSNDASIKSKPWPFEPYRHIRLLKKLEHLRLRRFRRRK